MTKEQFSVEIRNLRKESSAGKKQQNQVAVDARAIKASEEDFRKTNKGLCEVLFEGKEHIVFNDIIELKEDFREDLWHYEFHTYEPDEETGRISIESFLRSLAVCLHGRKVDKYMKRIKKVVKELEKMESKQKGVSLEEFIAFQLFLDNIDQLKSKVHQYKYLDFDMYNAILDSFSKNNSYCKEKKVKLSELQATGVFLLIDLDDSGELEPEEVLDVFMDRKLLGQSREEQAKQDAMDLIWKSWS